MSAAPHVPESAAPSMSDLEPMATRHRLVRISHADDAVVLHWSDGREDHCSALWLRDNCACGRCRHPQTYERTHLFIDHGRPTIATAAVDGNGGLEVGFRSTEESHVSRYTAGWLRRQGGGAAATLHHPPEPQLWDGRLAGQLTVIDHHDYMTSGDALRNWIDALQRTGIVLMRGVPQAPGQLRGITQRIGPVRGSNFGEYYDVISMPNPNASAYTSQGLELHTDLANWHSPPDVQLLFCVKNAAIGGDSLFADGFKVAEDLRAADPAAFQLLSTHAMEFRFHDASCDIRSWAPIIETDPSGRVQRIRFNNWLRTARVASHAPVDALYDALASFWRRLRDPAVHLKLRLEPGCVIAYDNRRVLHGRTGFDPASGERHLQGCYLYQDDVESTLRVLQRGGQ